MRIPCTIGYSGITPVDLLTIASHFDLLVDVRSSVHSRVPHWTGRAIHDLVGKMYVHRPDLGGRQRAIPAASLGWIRQMAEEDIGILLMCVEPTPAQCHRHHMIGTGMLRLGGIDIVHLVPQHGLAMTATTLQCSIDAQLRGEEWDGSGACIGIDDLMIG